MDPVQCHRSWSKIRVGSCGEGFWPRRKEPSAAGNSRERLSGGVVHRWEIQPSNHFLENGIPGDFEPKAAPAFNQDGFGVDSFNLTCSHKACSCIARVRRSRNSRTGMTRWHSISQCCGSSVAVYDSISCSLVLLVRGPVQASLPEFTGRSPELTDPLEIHYTLF